MTLPKKPTCRAEGCDDEVTVRGHCIRHYNALRHEVANSRGTNTPVTWRMLEDAGIVPVNKSIGRSHSDFLANVRAKLAKREEPTP